MIVDQAQALAVLDAVLCERGPEVATELRDLFGRAVRELPKLFRVSSWSRIGIQIGDVFEIEHGVCVPFGCIFCDRNIATAPIDRGGLYRFCRPLGGDPQLIGMPMFTVDRDFVLNLEHHTAECALRFLGGRS